MPKQLALLGHKRCRLLAQLADPMGTSLGRFGDVGIAFGLVGHYLEVTGRTHI
jgi:hypothetical protein